MPTATLKCRCCPNRARRETMLIIGNVAFIDESHKRAYQMKPKVKAKPKSLTKPKAKKKKLKSIARLVDDAAVLLQKLVRMKAAMPWAGGMCRCVTCGAMDHWKDLQGGHFIERGRKAVKLVEENCHPQCGGCNCFRMKTASGVLTYREYMVSMYGEQFVQDLIVKSKQTKKYTRAEVEGIIFDFTRQIQEQEARLAGRAIPQQRAVANG